MFLDILRGLVEIEVIRTRKTLLDLPIRYPVRNEAGHTQCRGIDLLQCIEPLSDIRTRSSSFPSHMEKPFPCEWVVDGVGGIFDLPIIPKPIRPFGHDIVQTLRGNILIGAFETKPNVSIRGVQPFTQQPNAVEYLIVETDRGDCSVFYVVGAGWNTLVLLWGWSFS
uniref:Uncharacterized protein n=1 Tax=Candidatus Kentrum sp. TUN TaxID=2126343 RepID=A0A451AEW1_9GAMM|nr:MAG: hypothetical protein BECKTUN1418D_GA0071000_12722 [Candidatus Kentron sp. TUN]